MNKTLPIGISASVGLSVAQFISLTMDIALSNTWAWIPGVLMSIVLVCAFILHDRSGGEDDGEFSIDSDVDDD